MPWNILFHPDAARELRKPDRTVAARIIHTLETKILGEEDPRTFGSALKGDHSAYWRWRIGDYRVVARIEDDRLTILVVRIAHRKHAYR